ncbi:sulfite exporter TauE/SafE family protein [Natrialbaceae archaeon AArc-T1-2]|uniref:sulfite exporter TauE/SafE family protein n=1 Tax=Natrialbaceae archaeon AArc-T1-2 TaxID=3053904 RepID=UPI00255AE020|nr:sulfite exporter TauE/SafE family protein [Natrialbaceae archaeon AArc-T1-2]WIV66610.1 sulfite exporter TauE/SafE family protein [Natrialbaceae archaeon AArc-T1-2]
MSLTAVELVSVTVPAHGAHAIPTEHVDLVVFLLVGVLAGAHCLGMCGPLVTAYADRFGTDDSRRANALSVYEVRQHTLFNLGRATSYAALGGLFGLAGALAFASTDQITAVGDAVRGTTGILVGIAIIASGLYYLRGRAGVPHGIPIVGSVFGQLSALLADRIDRLANSPGIVGLGAIHGLLPCPIIYPAYLYAFALGDPVRGALALGVLGLGTIPALFIYGTALGSLTATNRVRLHRALGVGFLILGYVPLQHGLMLYGIHLPHPPLPFYQPL